MKLYLNLLASLTATVYVAAFILVFSSLTGCERPADDPAPKPSTGWKGAEYEFANFVGDVALFGKLSEEPQDLTVDVYHFDKVTTEAAAKELVFPTKRDEDGELYEPVDPDQSVEVEVGAGVDDASNYLPNGTFGIKIPSHQRVVIIVTTFGGKQAVYNGVPEFGQQITFNLATGKGGRRATQTATLHFGNRFDYWFYARMHADIWYFPASKTDDEIRQFFQFVDSRNWNKKPSKPADRMDVLEQNPAVDYREEYWHSKIVKAGRKAVFVWNYLDSCNPRYKYRFDIYPPILAGSQREHIIGTDAARACL